MSGFYILFLLAVWWLVGWATLKLWKLWGPRGKISKVVHRVYGVGLFALWFGIPFWLVIGRSFYYHAYVEWLCYQDGGVMIYHKEDVPGVQYNSWGYPSFFDVSAGRDALGVDYLYIFDKSVVGAGVPEVYRYYSKVVRRGDGAVLGESVAYSHSYAGLEGPWHGAGYGCKYSAGADLQLLREIFVDKERG